MTISDVFPDAPATPGSGVPAVPEPSRTSHAKAGALGFLSALVIVALAAFTSRMAMMGSAALSAGAAVLLAILTTLGMGLLAKQARTGIVVALLTVVLASVALYVMPQGVPLLSEAALTLAWGGFLPILCGMMAGAVLAFGGARTRGRAEVRVAAELAASDETVGVTPAAPPSRRMDHVSTLALTAVCMFLILWGTVPRSYADVIVSMPKYWTMLVVTAAVSVVVARFTQVSSMGARVVGPIVIVLGIPAFTFYTWRDLPLAVGSVLHFGAQGVATMVLSGIVLMAIGWGAHVARRCARQEEAAYARDAVPALGTSA